MKNATCVSPMSSTSSRWLTGSSCSISIMGAGSPCVPMGCSIVTNRRNSDLVTVSGVPPSIGSTM